MRQAFGDDAVVMSTRPCAEGVEVLAMAPESVLQFERITAAPAEAPRAPAVHAEASRDYRPETRPEKRPEARQATRIEARQDPTLEPRMDPAVAEDVAQLQMSTLSFQDYVRQRMLKRLSLIHISEPTRPY